MTTSQKNNITTLSRTQYGELIVTQLTNAEDRERLIKAYALISAATAKKLIPISFNDISFDRKSRADGSARHHEIYDLAEKPARVLLCIREAEGTRYGVKTTSKEYVLISRPKSGITITTISKGIAAKAAKAAGNSLGIAIKIATGEEKLTLPHQPPVLGYKLVARTETGLKSVWDGSEWIVGKTRIERAQEGHGGGLYFYRDLSRAIEAAKNNEVFRTSAEHRKLAILRVEASGRILEYGEGKFAATKIKPIAEIGSTI